MTRDNAMDRARALFDSGEFFRRLAPLVAQDTGSDTGPDMRSGKDDRKHRMIAYLDRHMIPWLDRMGFACRILENPADPRAPFMIAKLEINLRQAGCHSGNWGGLLANPGIILSHAIASMVGPKGEILIDALRPDTIPEDVKAAMGRLAVAEADGPGIDPQWGEPGLSAAEKVYAWNTLDVLALECGDTARPVNVIPPRAWARLHIRFIEGFDPAAFVPAIRNHLDRNGFPMVKIVPDPANHGLATRMTPDNPWVKFTMASMEKTLGRPAAFLPNIGGTLPNDAFNKVIGMDTIWIPHSYRGCCQHAPNEHLPESVIREGLILMAGLFWDLGEAKNTGD